MEKYNPSGYVAITMAVVKAVAIASIIRGVVAGLIRFGFNYAETGDFWGSIGQGIKTAAFVMPFSFVITLTALKFPYIAKEVVIFMLSVSKIQSG
ncbi:hypothetical protein RBH29_17525 [Herbivorax sp. ANBcel31]|uniref:hypothetical protein n=1 Tax=Herbivorax sp. ANBcel31 TaxID=3069754 RepID=UPI0027B0BB94|nr:hypothetical protein [Herbivorax sp. ANBcel31]MDQ2088227.1 hypothetical protein [Herbivorax sp. ANBcel31]